MHCSIAHVQHSLQLRSSRRRKLFGELGVSRELMFTAQRVEAQGGQISPRWAGNTEQRSLPMIPRSKGYNLYLGGSFQTSREGECLWAELQTDAEDRIAMKAARQGKAPAKAVPEAGTDTVGIEGQLLGVSSLQHCLRAGRQQARRERLAATSAWIHGEQSCCNH